MSSFKVVPGVVETLFSEKNELGNELGATASGGT